MATTESIRGLASERRALREYLDLLGSPTYRGVGLPRGEGRTVIVLPGLFGNDFYLTPLRKWLRRLGYRPELSMVGVNAGCANRLLDRVSSRVLPRLKAEREIAIIGHSRGGMLGKAVAVELGERVSHFIALGSPLGGMLRLGSEGFAALARAGPDQQKVASPGVMRAGQSAMRLLDPDCDAPMCGCEYMRAVLSPWSVNTRLTAIYSPQDPIVHPEACRLSGARNIEVSGSHGGLVVNKAAFEHMAIALAE